MTYEPLELNVISSMFGYTVTAKNSDGSFETKLVENLENNPLQRNQPVTDGFLFRSPRLVESQLSDVFETLCDADEAIDFSLTRDTKTGLYKSYVRFENQEDATSFALCHARDFQKWSDDKEAAEQEQLAQKPQTIEVDEDGIARGVTVTVTTLGD